MDKHPIHMKESSQLINDKLDYYQMKKFNTD